MKKLMFLFAVLLLFSIVSCEEEKKEDDKTEGTDDGENH